MDSRTRRRRQRCFLCVWATIQLAMNVAWVATRWEHITNPNIIDFLGDLGNWGAFNGLVLFTLMTLLGGRNSAIERTFGLDRMLLTHRRLALWTVGLFLVHAVSRTWSISLSQDMFFDASILYRLRWDEWDIVLGRLAMLIMLVTTGLAYLGQVYLQISFKTWKLPHFLLYPALFMGFFHGYFHGDDTPTWPMLPLWALLLGISCLEVVRRLNYVLHRKHGHLWQIAEVRPETRDCATVVLNHPDAPGPFTHRLAGQFGVVRVPHLTHMDEPHPFTFSGPAPHDGEQRLAMTVKVAGDFTAEFITLPNETPVLVEGPYGVFLSDCQDYPKLAFIAGGVGVTPFLSALRTFRVENVRIPVTLIWANKTRADIIAADELMRLTRELPLTVRHVISREPPEVLADCSTERVRYTGGRVEPEFFANCLDGDERFYLCGPEPMMQATLTGLRQAFGIHEGQVTREHFFW